MSLNSIDEEIYIFEGNIKKEPEVDFVCILPSFDSDKQYAQEEESRHVKQENETHSEEIRKLQCKICLKIFKSIHDTRRHEKIHVKQQCKICNRKIPPRSFEKHMITHQNEKRERKFECKICSHKFLTNLQRNQHASRHSKRFLCDLCGIYTACTKPDILRHLTPHFAQGQYRCIFCRKLFDDRESFRLHSRQVHGDLKNRSGVTKADLFCRTCGKDFDHVQARKQHEKSHQGKVQCPLCDQKYKQTSLAKHLKTHKKEKKFECKVCQEKFRTTPKLYQHLKLHSKSLKCDLCEYWAQCKDNMRYHMVKHMKNKPFKCEICLQGFFEKSKLKRHHLTHFRPFPCNLCPVSFTLEKELNRHLKTHDKFKVFKEKSN